MNPLFTSGRLVLALLVLAVAFPADRAAANQDVYRTLPEEIEVVEYAAGDVDGDRVSDLAVLYTLHRANRLTLFRARDGRWERWLDLDGTFLFREGMTVLTFTLEDVTGNGTMEMLLYHLDADNGSMVTTVLSYDGGPPDPGFHVLLEGRTTPPGYPLLGRHQDRPAVTFLNMGRGDGYRRVWCWEADRFEICEEVVWERP